MSEQIRDKNNQIIDCDLCVEGKDGAVDVVLERIGLADDAIQPLHLCQDCLAAWNRGINSMYNKMRAGDSYDALVTSCNRIVDLREELGEDTDWEIVVEAMEESE